MDLRPTKDFLRHLISRLGLASLYARYRALKGEKLQHLWVKDRAKRFERIYEDRLWVVQDNDTLSGPGSTLATTRNIRTELPAVLERLEVTKLLDVGCGDWAWMRDVGLRCDYIGADIVPAVIARNTANFGGPRRQFLVLDAVAEPLPTCDAILCREVLFHLSFADALALLRNARATPARYLLATTDSAVGRNIDILTGDFSMRNLRQPPFDFPAPLLEIEDAGVYASRRLGVWRLSDLPAPRR